MDSTQEKSEKALTTEELAKLQRVIRLGLNGTSIDSLEKDAVDKFVAAATRKVKDEG